MNITITECGSAANIGSMALIESAIKIAKKIDKNCYVTILTSDIKRVQKGLKKSQNDPIDVKGDLFLFPEGSNWYKIIWLLKTILWIISIRTISLFTNRPYKLFTGRKANVLKTIADSDYVFCIGAERINDVYYKTAYLSLEALNIYEKMGAKLIHFSLTIGPIFYKSTIKKAAKVLDRSYAIFVRDQKSFNLLKELNVTKPYSFNTYDIAILQDKLLEKDEIQLFNQLGINPNEDYICVSVIDWLFRKVKGPVRQCGYNQSIAETLDYIIEKYHKKIIFTPTVIGIYKVDDVTAGKNIIRLMKHKKYVTEITTLLTPQELASVFSHCYFSIVTRMHAAILCTGAGNKPIIAINYLYKLREYMKNIGFENYSIDIDYTNAEDLKNFVDNMVIYYNYNRNKLSTQIASMRNNLLTAINDIKQNF